MKYICNECNADVGIKNGKEITNDNYEKECSVCHSFANTLLVVPKDVPRFKTHKGRNVGRRAMGSGDGEVKPEEG